MTRYIRIEATGLEGTREISAAGWDGQILRMTRDTYLKWRKTGAEKLGKACVCLLYADDFSRATPQQRFLHVSHIGHPPRAADTSDKDRPFWSVALVFTSAGSWMDTERARAVESTFIEWAREACRYEVANRTMAEVSEPDDLVDAWLAPVRAVLDFAGIDVFQFNREALFTLSRGPRFAKLDKAGARVVSAVTRTIELYADSRLGVSKFPETLEKVQALVDAGAATFDDEAGVVTFTRPTRLVASGPFDTLMGTFPKDWSNSVRRSLQDVFDEHKPKRPALETPSDADAEADAPADGGVVALA